MWANFSDDRSVRNLYYDKNGNILSMTQRGPAPPLTVQAVDIDQLGYSYTPNTNQLLSVNDGVTTDYGIGDFQDGNPGTDYDYDDNGNLTQDLNKGIASVTYTHFNKPQTVYFNDNKRISYSYDAAGNKVQELINLNGMVTRRDYVGNFIYRNDSLRYALTGQGRTVWSPGAESKEEFFVKDHLGNVRSVVDVYTYPIIEMMATYEIASANLETMVFDKVDEIRVEKPDDGNVPEDHMAGRLNATEEEFRVGTSILMHVMAGDRVEMQVDNYYDGYNADWDEVLNPEELMDNILTTLTVGNGGFEGSESHQTDLVEQLFNPENFLQAVDLIQDNIDANKPKAFLNYILFNEDMEIVTKFTGGFQVDGDGAWSTIGTPEPMDIPENGYLAVYVSTQTQIECDGCEVSASDVYFDYFTLRFTRGNLKEETHYYPFGLPMGSSVAADFMPNRHRYQSNEYRKEGGLNWMDFHARQYDPQIGRFLGVDPLADVGGQQVFSPYAAMGNNPVSMIDPLGLQSGGSDDIVIWGTRLDERRPMEVGSSFFTNMELSLRLAMARAAAWNALIMFYQGMKPSMSPLTYAMTVDNIGGWDYPKFSPVDVPLPPSSGKSYQSPGGGSGLGGGGLFGESTWSVMSDNYSHATLLPTLAASFATETKYGRWASMGGYSFSSAPYSKQVALMQEAAMTSKYVTGTGRFFGYIGGALTMINDFNGLNIYIRQGANADGAVSPIQMAVDGIATYSGIYGGWPGALASTVYFAASPIIWFTPGSVPPMPVPVSDATYVAPPVIMEK